MKKITLRDVAKAAGVSYATVSNVINKKGQMTEKTREKVRACIKKMNFHPDSVARTLVSGKSDTVVIISKYISSPFVSGIFTGVEHELYDTANSQLTLNHISTKNSQTIKQRIVNELLSGKKADAVIMLTIKPDDSHIKEFKKAGIPVVLIENKAVPGANSVRIDNFKGAYNAVDYLLKKGKKNIAIVTGPTGLSEGGEDESPTVSERLGGCREAMRDNGVELDMKSVYSLKHYTQEEGAKMLDVILRKKPDTDAIFCSGGDMAAHGIIFRAKQLGVRIPQDIALIGYDDIPLSAFMNPALTTVRQPLEAMGRKAFDLAMDALNGKIKGTHEILIMPELVIRESA